MRTLALILFTSLLAPAQSVRLSPYLQTQATFHPISDPAIPATLSTAGPEARATDGALWHGTSEGLWRNDPKAPPADRQRYFASKRWLPNDQVLGLLPDASAGMWVRTADGVSHIELRPMTLAAKAALFEKRVQERHNRHGLVADSSLQIPGDLTSNRTGTTDNDGLWTALYAAAECFRYSVTKSPEAARFAKTAVQAILHLEEITGRPGLPARSLLLANEPRPNGGLWVWSPDGKYQWKADTSSDEIAGHYFIFSIAWDLLDDPDLKQRIAATTRRMTDLILQYGLTLTDFHGQPTWWGRWDKDYFASPRGRSDSPLNALEILSFLKTAHHITGDARYLREYQRLIQEGYAEIATRYLELREEINYSDEELAMVSFYPLMQHEKDQKLAAVYRRALEGWWRNMPRQKNPLWTFIYLASKPGKPASIPDALWTLQRIPLDLITWTVKNSNRSGLEWEHQVDRFSRKQLRTLLPADERPIMKWNSNPFRPDGGNNGRSEDDGSYFLLPYWMGRYHHFLKGD